MYVKHAMGAGIILTSVFQAQMVAADPRDDCYRLVPHVIAEIPPSALDVCEKAVDQYPHDLTLTYRVARALMARRDYARGNKLFLKAAEMGQLGARFEVASSYANGRGVSRDIAEAEKHLRIAALGDHLMSQDALGELLANRAQSGDLVAASEALMWLKKAADAGALNAKYNLGVVYLNGIGVAKDPDKGIALVDEAADAGFAPALLAAGKSRYYGLHGKRDRNGGIELIRKASSAGLKVADTQLLEIERTEEAERIAAAKVENEKKAALAQQQREEAEARAKPSMLDTVLSVIAKSDFFKQKASSGGMIDAFARRRQNSKKNALKFWGYKFDDAYLRLASDTGGLTCILFLLDDTGSNIIAFDNSRWFGVAKAKWEGGPFGQRGFHLSLGGVPYESLTEIGGQPSDPGDFLWAGGKRSIFDMIGKDLQLWAQMVSGADIEMTLDGERIVRTMDPVLGSWANGTMRECNQIKNAMR